MAQCYDCKGVYDIAKAGYRPLCVKCQVALAGHPQVITKYGFPVDEDVKDLVEFLNDRKIWTSNSCQNQGPTLNHVTWIEFMSHDVVFRLLQCIRKEDAQLYEYLHQHAKCSLDVDDEDVEEVQYYYELRFPAEDLSYVTSRVLLLTQL